MHIPVDLWGGTGDAWMRIATRSDREAVQLKAPVKRWHPGFISCLDCRPASTRRRTARSWIKASALCDTRARRAGSRRQTKRTPAFEVEHVRACPDRRPHIISPFRHRMCSYF